MPDGTPATGGRDEMAHGRRNDQPAADSAADRAADPALPPVPQPVPPPPPPGPAARRGRMAEVPRGLVIVLVAAAIVVVVAGMRAIPNIIGPVFLALVLTILVDPIRGALLRRRAPRWVATGAAFLTALFIIVGLVVATVLGIVAFVALIPQYSAQWSQALAGLQSWLAGLGLSEADIQSALSNLDPSTIAGFAQSLLSGLSSALSVLLLAMVLLIFLAVDAAVFPARMARLRAGHEVALDGLSTIAANTRQYFWVASVFGGIVAVLDTAALYLLGIPAAFVWGLLAFVTNYIPNVGFIISLIPPAILGLLQGGPGLAIAVVAIYCVLNFVIQSVLQPKFVGDAVGLTTTVSFLSLIVWTYILGPLGAILAIPASLLVKGMLVDIDPRAHWLQLFFGDAAPARAARPAAPSAATPGPPLAPPPTPPSPSAVDHGKSAVSEG